MESSKLIQNQQTLAAATSKLSRSYSVKVTAGLQNRALPTTSFNRGTSHRKSFAYGDVAANNMQYQRSAEIQKQLALYLQQCVAAKNQSIEYEIARQFIFILECKNTNDVARFVQLIDFSKEDWKNQMFSKIPAEIECATDL